MDNGLKSTYIPKKPTLDSIYLLQNFCGDPEENLQDQKPCGRTSLTENTEKQERKNLRYMERSGV